MMPRPEREDFSGAVQHLFGRGNARQVIFRDDQDYRAFLARLIEFKSRMGVSILAYCLMPNHYHLEARTGKVPISDFMQCLLQSYTRIFNDRWNSVGHVFQGRFGNRVCRTDNDVRSVMRYIHQNPVKAKLCAGPEGWAWSSYQGMLFGTDPIIDRDQALSFFDGSAAQYQEFASRPISADELRSLDAIIAQWDEVEVSMIMSRSKVPAAVQLRRDFIEESISEGYRRSAIARFLGRAPSAITQLLRN